MEIRIPNVVQKHASSYVKARKPVDLGELRTKAKKEMRSFLITLFLFLSGSLVLWCAAFSEPSIFPGVAFVAFVVSCIGVYIINSDWRSWRFHKRQYEQAAQQDREGVVSKVIASGYPYLCHLLVERAKLVPLLQARMWALRRQWMTGRVFSSGNPGDQKERYERLVSRAECFYQAVQDELDSVAGIIERRGYDGELPLISTKEALRIILTASRGDMLIAKRLQALLYGDPNANADQLAVVQGWKPGKHFPSMIEVALCEMFFENYIDRWNDDLPEWDPSITKTAATF